MRRERVGRAKRVSRRGLLGVLAGAGAGSVIMGLPLVERAQASPSADPTASHQWAFAVDLRRCNGCGNCTKGCQAAHYLAKDQTWIKVYKMSTPSGQTYSMPRLCMQCENPPCLRVCPVGATFRTSEGVVLVDQNVCIGCRTCMAACPYEARYFNWSEPPAAPASLVQAMPEFPVPQQKGTVGKCVLCVHNVAVGKLPACVEACDMQALYIADLKADVATNGVDTLKLSELLRDNDAVRYREELGTRPRVWYILGHGQDMVLWK